jgi:hypothetical protein
VTENEAIRAALRVAFEARGMPARWGVSIAVAECGSRVLKMDLRNLTGRDGARGGAWGPTQITELTARAHGFTGRMESLTQDVELMARWTACIASRGNCAGILDLGAWWNAGRRVEQLSPRSTAWVYLVRLIRAYSQED